ncbi:plasmid replication protein RepC [Sagittula stellata]|uniref:Replication protein C n=1 Tax=Sagittula stellata (strain ATCC 700073 / DSM 11524 / E-37) TaxID=388399 RepID=A3KB15_SAGS3|nr:plasmid replication protein RepC [Sagittula stellata]EBA05641.1 Replication protein C [Sagittula stellata E-37]
MERLTVTPFGGRAVTAGLLASQAEAARPAAWQRFAKWELFRALCVARGAFGVSDRDLTVLNALLSFHKADHLEDGENLIVYPSNRMLAERAHGMAESTLRRHLAALVGAGLLLRHDSPNGKRYVRRDGTGEVVTAFGFDLRPLLVRAPDIVDAAEQARAEAEALRTLRERVVLIVRDAVKLLVYGRDAGLSGTWDAWDDALRLMQRALRRKLGFGDLQVIEDQATEVLSALKEAVVPVSEAVSDAVEKTQDIPQETEEMSGKDSDSGRHLQTSNPETSVSELSPEKGRGGGSDSAPPIPLVLVLKACPDVLDYARRPIETWGDLVDTADFLRGMLGISPSAWVEAVTHLGACNAAVTVACILQRADQIQSPGGYLRSLTMRGAEGAFSTGPMVMALLNGNGRRAA